MRKRKKDRDGLYKQPGSSRWYASYTNAERKRIRRSTGTDSRQEAEAILRKWKEQAHQQRIWGAEPPHSLHELMLAYIDSHSHKRSLERDGYSIKHLYRLIGEDKNIGSLTAVDVSAYKHVRANEGAAAGTINRETGLLSAAANWSRKALGWKIENMASGHRVQEPAGRERWLTREETNRLLEAARAARQSPHLEDFIILALHTGMRSGEILRLEWRRTDLKQDRIMLGSEDQKNGKPGMVPLNQTARDALLSRARWRAKHCPSGEWVFCDRQGRRIQSVKKGFKAAVERAGIMHCTPHDLRRTFGSWLAQAGVPIQQVSRLLRHSDIRVTDRIYAHLAPSHLATTVTILDDRHNPVIDASHVDKKEKASR